MITGNKNGTNCCRPRGFGSCFGLIRELIAPDRIRLVAVVAMFATLSANPGMATGQSKNIPPAEEYARVAGELTDYISREIGQKKIDAFSIALVDGDQVVWAHGFGFANPESKIPATADTIYRVGSVSKLLNDVAVMQLVEQGKLKLDADIRPVIPDFAPENPFGVPVTLRHLMNHESGLVRESPVGNYFDPNEPGLQATIASLNSTRLLHPPGSKTKYSNAAVSVAGYAAEQVSKIPFAEMMKANVLDPIGMTHSSYELNDSIRANLAVGSMWSYDGRRFVAPGFALGTLPAGNLYSSVTELARFMQVIFSDGRAGDRQILSPQLMAQMLQKQTRPDGQQRSYGIGFRLGSLDGHPTFEHGGAVYGFATQFRGLSDRKLGVVAVASLDVANGFVSQVTDQALRLMLAAKDQPDTAPALQSTTSIDRETARLIAGLYSDGGKKIRLFENQGRLILQSGTYDLEIRQLGDRLVVDDVQSWGPFVSWTDGVFEMNGQSYSRIDDARPADIRNAWAGLVGEYGQDHNTLFIYEDDGQLWALIEWVFRYPLTEVSENVFAFPDYGLYHDEQLLFSRDSAGNATAIVAAEVEFVRRGNVSNRDTFKIVPLLPPKRLLEIALGSEPPAEGRDFLKPELVELTAVDPSIRLDVRYATTNNFMDMEFYSEPRAFMQRPAAIALASVQKRLREQGYGLLVHDAYRPWYVTKMFWEATPLEMRHFVANPENGSRHNRGCAVDLTLVDLESGQVIPMVSGYDEFSERAYPEYPGGTALQRWHRRLLRNEMEQAGFDVYEFEWWHFDFHLWKDYPVLNLKFGEIGRN